MNKTHFNSKIDFACYYPNAKFKMVFLFSKKSAKKVSSRSGDQLCTDCFATLRIRKPSFNCCLVIFIPIPLFKLYTQIKIEHLVFCSILWSRSATEQIRCCQFSRTSKQSTIFTTRCFTEQRNAKCLNTSVYFILYDT